MFYQFIKGLTLAAPNQYDIYVPETLADRERKAFLKTRGTAGTTTTITTGMTTTTGTVGHANK